MFDPQRLIPLAFITELAFPPMEFEQRVLKELYLDTSSAHNFTEFKILNGGAVLSLGERRQFNILRDRVIIKDDLTDLTFDAYTRMAVDLCDRAKARTGIPIYLTQSVVIRLLSPIDGEGPAAKDLLEAFIKVEPEALKEFGRPLSGVGLRFVFPPIPQDPSEFQVRLEPYFRDPKMMFLENVARFLHPCQDGAGLAAVLNRADGFLKTQVAEFLKHSL